MTIIKPAASETGDPLLLTPGPLTTSASVKQAMVHDWGSRDAGFLGINRMVLDKIVELAGGQGTHVTVPVQGSGTFAVEAMITSFVPRSGKLLVLINGGFKWIINLQKGVMGERMLRRLRFDLVRQLTWFAPEDIRGMKPAEAASMINNEVEPIGVFIGDAFVQINLDAIFHELSST